jgi:hypothetical protein
VKDAGTPRQRVARIAGRALIGIGLLLPTPHRHAVDGTRWCAPPFAYAVPGDPAGSPEAEREFDEACTKRQLLVLLSGAGAGIGLLHLGNAPRRAAQRALYEEFRTTGKWPPGAP